MHHFLLAEQQLTSFVGRISLQKASQTTGPSIQLKLALLSRHVKLPGGASLLAFLLETKRQPRLSCSRWISTQHHWATSRIHHSQSAISHLLANRLQEQHSACPQKTRRLHDALVALPSSPLV